MRGAAQGPEAGAGKVTPRSLASHCVLLSRSLLIPAQPWFPLLLGEALAPAPRMLTCTHGCARVCACASLAALSRYGCKQVLSVRGQVCFRAGSPLCGIGEPGTCLPSEVRQRTPEIGAEKSYLLIMGKQGPKRVGV